MAPGAGMHVITRSRLQEFWRRYPDAERPLRTWLAIMRMKRYTGPHEVRQDFASASFLGRWRTVFNIGGNKYRLIVDMRYDLGRVYIRSVLTHEEYTGQTRAGSL
jgi:mRNA interferase HigB